MQKGPIFRRRRWILATALLLTACRQPEETRIGVVPKAVAHVFWQSVHAGAEAAAREAGVALEWKGPPAETDFARQIEIVDAMINSRVDGIVLAPTEATALTAVVERAATLDIPVTIFDSGINTDEYVSYVSTNNYDAGALAAQTMGELLDGAGEIVMVKMVPGSTSTMEREQGFEETLAKEFPSIRIVDQQYCMSDRAKALQVAENMLTAHPNLDGVFASAEPATIGASQALKSRELTEQVDLVGFDSSETIEQDLRGGSIDALVVQDPFQIGYRAVMTILESLAGETPPKRIDTPARVVTRENVDEPEIEELLHPDLEQYLR